MFLMFSKAL